MAIAKGKPAPPAKKRRFLKAKLVALGVVGLAGFIAVEAGYAGWGWAHLTAKVFPRDETVLRWLPPDTTAVAIVDPHLVDQKALSSASTNALQRFRSDLQKTLGIDVTFDVDKLALTADLAVAHGRFNGKKLGDRLADAHYTVTDHAGVTYWVRKGEDAMAVVEDSILLYGDETHVISAIEARDTSQSLAQNEQVTDRLKAVGWDHALVFTARINDDRPSVHAVLSGANGPRALTLTASTRAGLDVVVNVETASPGAAEDMKKSIDEKRQDEAALTAAVGADLAPVALDAGKHASLAIDKATVTVLTHLDADAIDKVGKGAAKIPAIADATKSTTLLKLLGGG